MIETIVILLMSIVILAMCIPVYRMKALPTITIAIVIIVVVATDIACICGLVK